MSVDVHFLGTGTCALTPCNASACYVVDIGGRPVVMDLGNGAQYRLLKAGFDYRRIDHILITHPHPDHISDIVMMLQSMMFTPGYTRTKRLTLVGSASVFAYLDLLLGFYAGSFTPKSFALDRVELTHGNRWDAGFFTVTAYDMDHMPGSLGLRLETSGLVIAYTGDTDRCDHLAPLLKDADLAIMDASFLHAHKGPVHLCVRDAALEAAAAGVKTLALSHRNPGVDRDLAVQEAREAGFSGVLLLPDDGHRLTLG